MKKKNLLTMIGLALVVLSAASPARAVVTYNPDDLLLGFYASGGEGSSTSVVFNIGQASIYRDATGTFNLSIGSVLPDVSNAFGDEWNTRSDVQWGIFGTNRDTPVGIDPEFTLYAVRARTTVGVRAESYSRASPSTQSQSAGDLSDLGEAYALTGVESGYTPGVNPAAAIQDSTAPNDFAEYQTLGGGVSFGYFVNALGNFGNLDDSDTGTARSVLDLFRMTTATGSTPPLGTFEGTFTINDSGVIQFSAAAIPEPSTFGILCLAGLAALVVGLRRRIIPVLPGQ